MNQASLAVRVAVLAAIAVLSGAGGAGAATMITGRQIANGTLTGADLRDDSLRAADLSDGAVAGADVADGSVDLADLSPTVRDALRGSSGARGAVGPPSVRGYTVVERITTVNPFQEGTVAAECPSELPTALSVQGLLRETNDPVQTALSPDERGVGVAFARNETSRPQALFVQVVCAVVQ